MKMPVQQRSFTKSGKAMKTDIAPMRLSMAIRLIPEADFLKIYPELTRDGMARHFKVAPHDIEGLEEYYEIDTALRRYNNRGLAHLTLDQLADALWPLLEDRLRRQESQ